MESWENISGFSFNSIVKIQNSHYVLLFKQNFLLCPGSSGSELAISEHRSASCTGRKGVSHSKMWRVGCHAVVTPRRRSL
jgi:hypothetical protein